MQVNCERTHQLELNYFQFLFKNKTVLTKRGEIRFLRAEMSSPAFEKVAQKALK